MDTNQSPQGRMSEKDFMRLLSEMKREVDEFHPFLNELFKKLPNITNVHYTHGRDEMGADFILAKNDLSLEQIHYIGVVAKLGQIKIDHIDVERQIDECMVRRLAPDGREEIQIQEVWVTASGNITESAKRKIADKYRGRKVSFVKDEQLAKLAEKHIADYGESIPVAYAEYRDRLVGQIRDLDNKAALIPGLIIPYQFPDIDELRPDNHGLLKSARNIGSMETLYETILRRSFCLIESGMGGGKSRLLREVMRFVLNQKAFSEANVVPLYVSCSDLAEKYEYDIDRLILDSTIGLNPDAASHVVVAVDGFDELRIDLEEKQTIARKFSTWASSAPGRSLALTSRPSDELHGSWAELQNIAILRLRPLRGKKALALFTAVGGSAVLSSRIQKDIANSPLLKSLDASPISYTLLARIIKENDQEIPSSVPELFAKYFELVLGRWEIEKGLRKQVEYSVMHACLAELSESLLDNNRSEMSLEDATRIIDDYSKRRGLKVDARTFIDALADRSYVLYIDHLNATIGFRHRAFTEFFYAQKLNKAQSIDIDARIFHPYWIGTFYFLAGLKKDCPDLIQSLTDLKLDSELHKLMRIVNFGHILQAAYMTPQKEVAAAVKGVFLETADLYRDLRAVKYDSVLTKLTVMQLLGVLRGVMIDIYGYSNLEAPIGDAICDLAKLEHSERNALALLFASLAHGEADGRVDFDELIGAYGDALPFEVKMLIKDETKKLTALSGTLKKFNRNLVKSIQANNKGQSVIQIKRLFESPIKSLPIHKA